MHRTVKLQEGSNIVTLPVNPKEITISYPQLSKKTELLGGGYIAMGKKGLMTTNLSTFIPHDESIYAKGLPQASTMNLLKSWKETGTTVLFTIDDILDKISCYITGLETAIAEGDKDIDVKISLSECRALVKTKKTTVKKPTVKKHTVKKGEQLTSIARKLYGDSKKWKVLYKANKKLIGCDPKKLKVGIKLIVPKE